MPIFDVEANGSQFEVEGPDMNGAIAALQQHFNAPPPAAENSLAGSAKALGIGGVKGLVGLAGTPADLADLGARGVDYLAGTNLHENYTKPVADVAGYEGLKKKLEGFTGPLYEPKTGIEKGLQTLGEFGSIGLLGPGSLARKAITQVAAPALASEAAGAATEGTALEPYARIGAAVTGAGVASKIGRMADARSVAANAPKISSGELGTAVDAAYETPAIKATRYNPNTIGAITDNAANLLKKEYYDAPSVYRQLELMKTPMNGPAHSIDDVNNGLKRLREIRKEGGAEGAAASIAINYITDTLPKIGSLGGIGTITGKGAVVAGDAKAAAADMKKATQLAAAEFRDKAIQKIIDDAKLSAGSAHSGGNFENALRQGVKAFVKNPSNRGSFSLDEWAAFKEFAMGSKSANIMRRVSKLLGGGGGLGQLMAGAAGSAVAGPFGMVAAPAMGMATNALGSHIALNKLNQMAAQTRMRSPIGAAMPMPPPQMPQLSPVSAGLLGGLRAASIPTAPQFLPFSYQ